MSFQRVAYYIIFVLWTVLRKLGIAGAPRVTDIQSMASLEGFKKEI